VCPETLQLGAFQFHSVMTARFVTCDARRCVVWTLGWFIFHSFFSFCGPTAQPPPPVGQGLLITEASRSYWDELHSVGLFWTSDQPVAETSTWQHTTITRNRRPCTRRDSNSHSQQFQRPQTHTLYRAAARIAHRFCTAEYMGIERTVMSKVLGLFFLLGISPASEFYVPTFRNTVSSIFISDVVKNSSFNHSDHNWNWRDNV
jgi:hypothetical protein